MTEVSTPFSDPGEMSADMRSALDGVFRVGGIGDLLGIRLLDWGPGWSRLQLEPSSDIANIASSVHGGALYTLADSAFEVACNSYGRICVALDVTVHHASAAPLGEPVVAEAIEVSRSPRSPPTGSPPPAPAVTSAPGIWRPRTHLPLAPRLRALAAGLARRPLTTRRVSRPAAPTRSAAPRHRHYPPGWGVSSTGRAADF